LITAATKGSDPVRIAGEVARQKGRVVVVGAVGMDIPRDVYYERELELRLATSYGPGRYDPVYEEKGIDYPFGYVRWTERRNMAAFAELLEGHRLALAPLITHRFPIEKAAEAYRILTGERKERYLAILIRYPGTDDVPPAQPPAPAAAPAIRRPGRPGVAFVRFATSA